MLLVKVQIKDFEVRCRFVQFSNEEHMHVHAKNFIKKCMNITFVFQHAITYYTFVHDYFRLLQ